MNAGSTHPPGGVSDKTPVVTVLLWTGWGVFGVATVLGLWLIALIYSIPLSGRVDTDMARSARHWVVSAAVIASAAFLASLVGALIARSRGYLSRSGTIALVLSALSVPAPVIFAILWVSQR